MRFIEHPLAGWPDGSDRVGSHRNAAPRLLCEEVVPILQLLGLQTSVPQALVPDGSDGLDDQTDRTDMRDRELHRTTERRGRASLQAFVALGASIGRLFRTLQAARA